MGQSNEVYAHLKNLNNPGGNDVQWGSGNYSAYVHSLGHDFVLPQHPEQCNSLISPISEALAAHELVKLTVNAVPTVS